MNAIVGDVIGVLVDGEFQDQFFTNEDSYQIYVKALDEQNIKYEGVLISYHKLKAIQAIQYLVDPWISVGQVVSRIDKLGDEVAEETYRDFGVLNDRAFAKKYFDYFLENRLHLSNNPSFDLLFAENENTLNYSAFLEMEVMYLQGFIKALNGQI